ncbi:MAG: hypothetical protein NDI60_01715 [Elusimicrobiales bacterium]|nr:hypothetical protein [Elusimicrobiales bacterium]
MPELPRLRCPGCGKYIGPAKAKEIPPANTYEDCLRRCEKCRIGATNAKNPAKTKFIHGTKPQEPQPPQPVQEPEPPQDPQPPQTPQA